MQLPFISTEKYSKYETDFTKDNLFLALKSMPNNKSPSNNGLSKKFYETFCEDITDVFIDSLKQAKMKGSFNYLFYHLLFLQTKLRM